MTIRRVVPNIVTECLDESRKFYTDFLGFHVAMDRGWIITLSAPANPTAQLSLLQGSSTPSRARPSFTVEIADVDAVHAKAVALGVPIIYPLTTESWGVRRFHVTDPNGVIINLMSHHPE